MVFAAPLAVVVVVWDLSADEDVVAKARARHAPRLRLL